MTDTGHGHHDHAGHRDHEGHDGHGGHGHSAQDDGVLAEVLDLDARLLSGLLDEAVDRAVRHLAGSPCERVLDVGAGTGTGTVALLQRLPDAHVTALDLSSELLDRLAQRAEDLGLGDRVGLVAVDLDEAWPALAPVDLVWASSSLHHFADPDRALAQVLGVLRPGGVLAVLEMDAFPRFLPDDVGLGRPGLEQRCHDALAAVRAESLPHQGSDWGLRLSQAGFEVVDDRELDVDLHPPLPPEAGRYAQLCLSRVRGGLAGVLEADDLAALDVLLDADRPEGVLQRGDLSVRTVRRSWVARRP